MAVYDRLGDGYARQRRPDPRIAATLLAALGDARSVVNVGAGTGSYEPDDREVLAVEPSQLMIDQRPAGSAPCLCASADALPLADKSFDAAMAVLTIHHWPDQQSGLRELVRVARKRVVLLSWVPDGEPFWLTRDYFPEILAFDRTVFPETPALKSLCETIIGPATITQLPVPHDCVDGFLCAYWRRPQAYLDPAVRGGMSSFSRIHASAGLERLEADLNSGRWASANSGLAERQSFDAGYRLIVCELGG